ncbi:MAG: coiled coil domain-containing protein [Gammaproteobacteria bacterium]
MDTKEAYEQKLESQLNEWKAEITKLKAKADRSEADVRLEYQKQIGDLRAKQETAQAKLDELKRAGEGGWKDLKAGTDRAWETLHNAIKSAVSRFK